MRPHHNSYKQFELVGSYVWCAAKLSQTFEISEIFPFLGIPKLSQLIEFLSPHAWLLRENTSHTAIPLYPGLYHSEPQPPKGGYDFRGCLIRPTPSHRCPRHPLTPGYTPLTPFRQRCLLRSSINRKTTKLKRAWVTEAPGAQLWHMQEGRV